MNRHYVLYDKDLKAGYDVDYMSEKCAAAENKKLEQEGGSVTWIPYEQYLQLAEKRARLYRELHSSVISRAIAHFSK